MKRIISIMIALLAGSSIYAQGVDESKLQVISSAGASQTKSDISVSWTIGELATTTLKSGDYILTQGFHQGNLYVTGIDDTEGHQPLDVSAFPNPTNNTFNLMIGSQIETNNRTNIEIVDVTGRVVYSKNVAIGQNEKFTIDVNHFKPGVYIVRVINAERIKMFKLVKE